MLLVLTSEPHHKFSIPIKSEEYDADTEEGLTCNLVFTYTSKYPDEAPHMEIEDTVNFEDDFEQELLLHLQEQVNFNSICSIILLY